VPHPPARPLIHFTPPHGWLNDPNGLVHAEGVFHLCYQHQPDGLVWGPMHWGHATSTDLLTWEHQPLALVPDHLGTAFSGSAVVDHEGVAGFGAGALVAFYTHHDEGRPQSQGVAASVDGGTTWRPYDGNPVLRAPEGLVDFRDPKVFRYGDAGAGHWVMVLAAGDEVALYRSDDLLSWTPGSTFGRGHGAHGGFWETPDLFELEVAGTAERRWVLAVSVMDGGPAGGTGTQYFVGSFDGTTFTSDDPAEGVRWVDHGADFYAPQSWSDAPDGRRIWLAWMSNWNYARTTPASTWRGAMTVPRDVSLRESDGGVVLAQQPVAELAARGRVLVDRDDLVLSPGDRWDAGAAPAAYDLDLRLDLAAGATAVEVEVHAGAGSATRVRYLPGRGVLQVERAPDGIEGTGLVAVQEASLDLPDGALDLRVVVDTCSVEVFAAGGRVVLTNQVFPAPGSAGLTLVASGAPVPVERLLLRDLSAG
jgi:sucrose-6-phosphate hydrolase SacC (GH32 family)